MRKIYISIRRGIIKGWPNSHLLILFFSMLISCNPIEKQTDISDRLEFSLNKDWSFRFSESSENEAVSIEIPHTWNKDDSFESGTEYKRTTGIYTRELILDKSLLSNRLFVCFDGANQVAEVYVNHKLVARHIGGYTGFNIDITDYVKFGKGNPNILEVRVNNEFDETIPPLSADFTFYGGIYRDITLVATNPVHFSFSEYGAKGIKISTTNVSEKQATVQIEALLENQSDSVRNLLLVTTIIDKSGIDVLKLETPLSIEARSKERFLINTPEILNPDLWSPDNPSLYKVRSELIESGTSLDKLENTIGFRFFRIDPESGFYLNGKNIPLIGTNRHQDYEGIGNALSDSLHIADLQMIKDAGFNFLRLAHYPQDHIVLETADKLGLIIWEEIPIVDYVSISAEFKQNCEYMLKEMIHQHYNHPSIFFWGFMNEIFLKDSNGYRGDEMDFPEEYLKWTVDLAKSLNKIVEQEDPARLSAIAIHQGELYNQTGLANLTDILGYNLYPGWYFGKFESLGRFLDSEHEKYPERIIFLSEYGAGSDERLHSMESKPFDFTSEYQKLFLESYLKQIMDRPYLGGAANWAFNDFGSVLRGDTKPGINQKGLVRMDRSKKDSYFLFQANLSSEPVIYIASRDWSFRGGANFSFSDEDNESVASQAIDVYSNLEEIELVVNGNSLGVKEPDEIGKTIWMVAFQEGSNQIIALAEKDGKLFSDSISINYANYPEKQSASDQTFSSIGVNVGSNAQYTDIDGYVWQSDQSYISGSYGYVGGKADHLDSKIKIVNAINTALYYTFINGVEKYIFDVPSGEYTLDLYFSNHLNQDIVDYDFNIYINDELVSNLNSKMIVEGSTFSIAMSTVVNDSKSIDIIFKGEKESVYLSAIKLSGK